MKTKYFLLVVLIFSIAKMPAQTEVIKGLSRPGAGIHKNLQSEYKIRPTNNLVQTDAETDWFWQYPKPQGNTLRDIYVFNKDTAIAVGDLSTIIKTTDGGNTWDVKTNVSPAQILFSVFFLDALNGWAGGGNYLLKTTDGGNNWSWVYGDTPTSFNTGIFAVYFVDADTGFVFGNDGQLARTTDGGNSWNAKVMDDYIGAYLDIFQFNAVTFTSKDTGFVVGDGYYGNEIYKTTDCGRSWSWNEQILLPKNFTGFNDICFADKNHGYIVGYDGAFVKTTDGGNTWQQQNLTTKNNNDEYAFSNSIFFTDTLTGWIVGGNGTNESEHGGFILKTTDGGENWEEVDTNKSYGQIYKIRFSNLPAGQSNQNNGWLIGQSGIIYKTTDTGNNWVSQREPEHQFNSVYFVDENIGWAVTGGGLESGSLDSGIVFQTTNGGSSWERQYSADSILLSSIYAIDNQNVFIAGSVIKGASIYDRRGFLLSTNNGGQTWQNQTFDTLLGFISIYFSNDSTGWVSVYDGTLLKTVNKGIAWTKILSGTSYISPNNIQFADQFKGWYASVGLFKTTDGGKSWFSQIIDSTLSLMSFHFVDANYGWAIIYNYGGNNVFRTSDGGNSWTACGKIPADIGSFIYFINTTSGWISYDSGLGYGSIFKTIDGGNTWHGQDLPTNYFTNLFFLNENTGWAVGDGIFKTTNGGGFVAVKEKNNNANIPKQITLFQNYPNPFNPSTMINYQLPMISYVTLKVYDILGREVKTLVNGLQQAGTHPVSFNASNMASGVYFYRLLVQPLKDKGNFIGTATSETKKMILLR